MKKQTEAMEKQGRRQGPSAPLSREQIVAAALAVVDREGPKALSMRRLGAELGVDPMAVYYHIPHKEALLDAIVEAVMGSIDLRLDDPSRPAEERILSCARAYAEAMLAHRNALPIVLSRGPATPASLRPVELLTGILRKAGLAPLDALAGMNALAAAVRGLVGMLANGNAKNLNAEEVESHMRLLPPGQFPYLEEATRSVGAFCGEHGGQAYLLHTFEYGIRALARGLLAGVRHLD